MRTVIAIPNIHVLITNEGGGIVFEERTGSYGTIFREGIIF